MKVEQDRNYTDVSRLAGFCLQTGICLCLRECGGRLSPVSLSQHVTRWQKQLFLTCRSQLSSIVMVTHGLSNKEKRRWAGWHSCQYPGVFNAVSATVLSVVFISDLFWHEHQAKVCVLFLHLFIHPSSHLSLYPSIHHCYLMRWCCTSRVIGCVQSKPDLIRPHHWNASHWYHTGFTI